MKISQIKRKKAGIVALIIVSLIILLSVAAPALIQTADAAPVGNIYYDIDSLSNSQAKNYLTEVQNAVADEAMILLKNEDNALPIAATSKVTVFGNGQNKTKSRTDRIDTALASAGLTLNPTVQSFYASAPGRSYSPSNGHFISGLPTYEAPISTFTFTPSDYTGYKDAAIVVLTRIAGEGTDLPTRMAKGGSQWGGYDGWGSSDAVDGARSVNDHYLQLDKTETDLLSHVCSNFDKVIILINSQNMMELGFLDDSGHYAYHPQIKAAVWVGFPEQGAGAIGRVITGQVNPSGHLVSTATRDHTKDPTYQNFSRNRTENGNRYYTGTSSNTNYYFVHYEEGIYTGYYYYETRGFTEGAATPYTTNGSADKPHILGTTTTSWDSWYDAHVIYPLGHGLSYTSFDWELITQAPANDAQLSKDGVISATVRVTNTGTTAGKEVVQLYYSAPYTEGGIEKSHVVLGNFEKTGIIEPNEYEDITVTLDVSEMKSYDYSNANGNGFKGYELEGGAYKINLGRNAHVSEFTLNYTVAAAGIKYDTDTVTDNPVGNLFDDVSEYYIGNTNYSCAQYMSRNDFAGTFPTSGTKYRQVNSTFIEKMSMPDVNAAYDADKPWYTDEQPYFAPDKSNSEVKLNHLIGRDYDDPLWDVFMDQLTRDEMNALPDHGFYETVALERVNKPATRDVDGPWGWGGTNAGSHSLSSLCGPMLAYTYNRELAFDRGAAMAEAGYHGNDRITGWYAPGMNIHRSPFSGRNYEYYSEDARISGIITSAEILGAKSKGMYSYAKHMFLNDQETNRDGNGLVTWANEQSMRELYAKPFEIAVKDGGVQAIMSAFNRIGVTPARHSWETFTGMLRDEWGFKGMVVTDWANGGTTRETDLMIRAGNDLRLGNGPNPSNSQSANTPTHNAAIKRAAKNIMFTVANSNAMNGVGESWGNMVNNLPLIYAGKNINVTKDASTSVSVATATAMGDVEDIEYSLISGNLPEGLTLNSDGTVTGTPTGESGLYKVTLEARDVSTKYFHTFSPARTDFNFVLAGAGEVLGVDYEGGALSDAVCGAAYSSSVATAGVMGDSTEVIEYLLADGSSLPDGLYLNKNGTLYGTPTTPVANHSFMVRAQIANSVWAPTEAEFTVSVIGRLYLNKMDVNLYIGKQFNRQLDAYFADGGDTSLTYAVKSGSTLPSWLTLDTATGGFGGIPSAFGTYKFTITAQANGFTVGEAEITVVVHQPVYVT